MLAISKEIIGWLTIAIMLIFFLNKKTGGVALTYDYAKKRSRDSIYDICNLVEKEKNLYLLRLKL